MHTLSERLPVWMKGAEVLALADAVEACWSEIEVEIERLKAGQHIESCHAEALKALAWERAVSRLEGESEGSWRGRVRTAFITAKQAGTLKGLTEILRREVDPDARLQERVDGLDWDIVLLELPTVVAIPTHFQELLAKWGQLCRRYTLIFKSRATIVLGSRFHYYKKIILKGS